MDEALSPEELLAALEQIQDEIAGLSREIDGAHTAVQVGSLPNSDPRLEL